MTLLDRRTDGAREGGLAFENFNGAFECIHGEESTKLLVGLSTRTFVETRDKGFCTVRGVKATTFQDRMDVAIERAGDQSTLARKVNAAFGTKLKPQNIQYLASRIRNKKTGKLAQGSRHTPQIAAVVGLMAEWLASGTGPQNVRNWKPPKAMAANANRKKHEPLTKVRVVRVKVKETGEKVTVELTIDALKVAKAFMELSLKDRVDVMRNIEVRHSQSVPHVPDGALGDLAAPGTPTAERAKASKAGAGAKDVPRPKPPSRHAQ